jgi:O-antigen/teichoic acid export membrane protein
MPGEKSLKQWLMEQRSSSRLAYMLILSTRLLSNGLSLVWQRLLLDALGKPIMTSFVAFQSVVSLGGLGDLGLGGAVGIRTGQAIGQKKEDELIGFLAVARTMFLLFALIAGGGFLVMSPWLPHLLGFKPIEGAGSMVLLFALGAFSIMSVMFSSYIYNVNYGCGNVTWPVVPQFIILQSMLLTHVILARAHLPLWVQYIPYVACAFLNVVLVWFYVRVSYPRLAQILPLKFNWPLAQSLVASSFWMYLCSLGNSVYRNTDALVINASPLRDSMLVYSWNYKFCDLAVFAAITASTVALPKITQWMASLEPEDQKRVRVEMNRLNQFQTLIGCGAALAYLLGNNLFMKIWMMHKQDVIPPAPLLWQTAFALNMVVTTCGDASIQLSLRSGSRGLRFAGSVIGLTALLNLGLSILAIRHQWIAGVAFATVLAQSVLSLLTSAYLCNRLNLPFITWAVRSWVIPVAGISFAAFLRFKFPEDTIRDLGILALCYLGMLVVAAWGLGIKPAFIKEELKILRSFGRK